MKKSAFVPSADHLENRTVMSGVPYFHGMPVLTSYAANKVYVAVENAFKHFATKGENYGLLEYNLGKAVNRVPYNFRDGLYDEVRSEASALQDDIASGVSHPVLLELANTAADITSFIQGEVADGIFITR